MNQCDQCDAFKRTNPKGGVCRANPPTMLVFGMEQVNVPGLQRGAQGMRPLTGTAFPETPNEGWCRQFQAQPVATEAAKPVFDPSKLKPQGDTNAMNGVDIGVDKH